MDAQDTVSPAALAGAARVLAALGLVTAFGHVSVRSGDQILITPAAALGRVRVDDLIPIHVNAVTLPRGAPAEAWIHLRVYAVRDDVTAIARAQPPDAFAAGAVSTGLRPLYGQASWLGEVVPVHDDARLLRGPDLATAAAATLGGADAMLLRGNGALTTGADPGLAVARMWLLASACRAFLAASAAGTVRPLSATEVDSWRAVQAELLPRLWRHLRDRHPDAHSDIYPDRPVGPHLDVAVIRT